MIFLLNQNIECTILYEQRLKSMISLKTAPSCVNGYFLMITCVVLGGLKLFILFEHGEVINISLFGTGARFGY